MKERVVVAMSGGVDSSVAAALLKEEGCEVIGITMCFNLPEGPRRRPACCSIQAIDDARRVAHKLGIRHYVLNMQKALKEQVIDDFCSQYLSGRTPNPCVICNQHIKFGTLLKKAVSLGAKFLATGHYARVNTGLPDKVGIPPRTKRVAGRVKDKGLSFRLEKAKDKTKDQSYFLYRLSQSQLRHVLFPLGNYTKLEVRVLAKKFGLSVADKPGSQEICFLPDDDYRSFLKTRIGRRIKPGDIVDREGNVLGRHEGIAFYTIGQRQGLGIAAGYPLYVTALDRKKNCVVVGKKEEALKRECLVRDTHFICAPLKKKVALKVRIRYNHREAGADVWPLKNKIRVKFKKPQFAITPGQSAVFYQNDIVLGGGIIDEALS